tara:strand:- start:1104 stop:2252 length:1149 start_codon:yes stop_codon:yes gene_type:complete
MVSNPYHFSRLGTTVSAQITDGTDAPHTGLIKALAIYSTGSYPVKTSSDFNITAASASAINITSGKVVRDGELQASITAGSNLSIGATSAGKTYSLVVVDSSNAFAVRTTTTDNLVPELTAGDIPIAIVLYTAVQSTMEFQYFTNRKEANTLSVAYSDSNVYNEILKMEGNGGNVELTGSALTDISSLDSAADRLLVRDATNNQLKLVAPSSVGSTYSDANAVSAIETEAGLDFSASSNDAIIENTNSDKDIIFKINDGGTPTEVIRIDGDVSKVGIGTATPAEKLSVSGNIRSSGDVIIGGALDHNGSTVGFYATTPATKQTVNNLGTTSVISRPPADPTANPGFEPGLDAYVGSLEAEISNLRTKLDAVIDALQLYGLIS